MENSQIAQHMAMLYEKGLYTDSIIHIFGRTFRVHRVSIRTLTINWVRSIRFLSPQL